MGRYRGKREAPEPEKGLWANHKAPEEEQDPFAQEPPEQGDPFAQEAAPPARMGDPFAEEAPETERQGRWAGFGAACGRFFRSKKGKIITTVVCCVLAFAVGGVIAVKSWVKPPDLPVNTDPDKQQNQGDTASNTPEGPDEPTDEELYPDDGYMGELPTVSGDRKEGVYTFLLVGTDMDDGNTDTIMVVSYDTVNQDINIMSIPRDTMINESWDIKKINSVYSRTGSSIDSLANRVRKLIGFKPDFYVKVDLEMFVELVDLVGGVEFDVPQDMDYDDDWQDLHIHLKKGVQTLDGEKAMELVRFRRYSEGDIKRVQVQQDFMKALIKECLSIGNWGKVKAYIDLAMENIQTDLEFGSIVWFAANVLGFNGVPALNMDDVYTCTIPGDYWGEAWSRSTSSMQSYVTIYPNQVVTLVNERFNPYEQKVTAGMLDAMSILSNGNIASSTGTVKDTQHNAIMAVQRGEAYYDESGSIVYGTPPEKPKQDEFGNYYITDENGNMIYTDENGTPIDPVTPPETTDTPDVPSTDPGTGSETGQSGEPGQGGETGQTGGEGEIPAEPTLPPEDSSTGIDEEMPEWLQTRP